MRKVYVIISVDQEKRFSVVAVYTNLKNATKIVELHNQNFKDWTYTIKTEVLRTR